MPPTTYTSFPILGKTNTIPPATGVAFNLLQGQHLTVISPQGVQVSDLFAFSATDHREVLSSGRTLDYASRLYLTTQDPLYSNRSNILLRITEDTCGRHDFTLTPCSKDTFRIIYNDEKPHRGCHGNFVEAFEPYAIGEDEVGVAFNCFMNVVVDGESGRFEVLPPRSKAGDYISFVAERDLVVGLTACSALQSNGGSFKPIEWRVD